MLYYFADSVIIISFIASLATFRLAFPKHLRLFSVLLGLTALDEICILFYSRMFHLSNLPWYNCFMGVEFWMLGYYHFLFLEKPLWRKFILGYLIIFPVVWLVLVFFIFGVMNWNSYLSILGSFFTILFSVLAYWQLFTARRLNRLRTTPEFWIATGLIIFYACNLPYLGTLNYLTRTMPEVSKKLLVLLQVLNIVMYSLFTYAFLCRIRLKKS